MGPRRRGRIVGTMMMTVGVLCAPSAMAQSYKQFGAWLAFCDNTGLLKAEMVLPPGKKLASPEAGTAEISLDGAAAALVWIDDQRARVGTSTALIRKGPMRTVAPAPAKVEK